MVAKVLMDENVVSDLQGGHHLITEEIIISGHDNDVRYTHDMA